MNNTDQSKNNLPPIEIKTKDGQKFEVPVEGSLGLLALGYTGLMAWRMKRKQAKSS